MENNYNSSGIDAPENAFNPSSKWKRFFGFLIDYFAIIVLSILISVFIPSITPDEENVLTNYLYFGVIFILYYWPQETATGKTLGKMLLGMRVINEDGQLPDSGTVFKRTISRLVPFEPLSLLFSDDAWHDSWSDTQVVNS